jgi:hypothetical protein
MGFSQFSKILLNDQRSKVTILLFEGSFHSSLQLGARKKSVYILLRKATFLKLRSKSYFVANFIFYEPGVAGLCSTGDFTPKKSLKFPKTII